MEKDYKFIARKLISEMAFYLAYKNSKDKGVKEVIKSIEKLMEKTEEERECM